jgi:pimeloyl-ACP methyl ester carboxylesterase
MPSVDVLTIGTGPGLVVIPGGSRRAHHYKALATALASTHTVHVIERRGRGASPAQGPGYGLDREVDDVLEVLDRTGSSQVFGHSYGGLVALHAGLSRDLARLIVFEPAVSIAGSLPLAFLPRFERLTAGGRDASAAVEFLHGLGFLPRGPHMVALFWLAMHLTTDGRELRAVLPTLAPEARAARAQDSDGSRYAAITAPTLLLGGARSPAYLLEILPALAAVIPTTKLVISPDMDHNAPDLGAPAAVADLIRA